MSAAKIGELSIKLADAALIAREKGDDVNAIFFAIKAAETLALAHRLTEEGDLHTSVWSHLEIWLLTQPQDQKATLEFLNSFIAHPINEEIARRAAELLKLRGQSEPPLTYAEAVIAATALQHGLTLVTYNAKNLETLAPLRLLPNSYLSRGAP